MKNTEYCAKCERPVTDTELETGTVRLWCELDDLTGEWVGWYQHIYECQTAELDFAWEKDPDAWKA